MKDILYFTLFELGGQTFSVGQLLLASGLIILLFAVYRTILRRYFPKVLEQTQITTKDKGKLVSLVRGLAILCLIIIIINILNLDKLLLQNGSFNLTVLDIAKALIFVQVARLLDWIFSNLVIHNYYTRRDKQKSKEQLEIEETETSAKRLVQYVFYTIVTIYLLQNLHWDLTIFERSIDGETLTLRVSNFLYAILVILIARLVVWSVTQLFLYNIYNNKSVDIGSRYAINQLVKYIIYVLAIIVALDMFGINMNLLLGGAAALLVGIGLGLQQTFNDFISGVVILFERSVRVGDVLEVDGQIGRVREIGLRSSILETRGNINLVVPNHKLVNEKVTNWNHYNETVRFHVEVGVAYGSDTILVKKLLLQTTKESPYVLDYPAPFVRFLDFGDSSLMFGLYFFSKNLIVIEDIKSDIRFEVDRLFREHNISIPFPQRDIHIVKGNGIGKA